MTDLATRVTQIKQAIANAQGAVERSADVQLLAVSKTRPVADVISAYDLGLRAFGENYVQEGADKVSCLAAQPQYADIEWHFIGPIQSNKSRSVAEHFDWVHTIDRLKIAQRLNDQRPSEREPLNVLLQVNISEQTSKSGVSVGDITTLAEQVSALPNLCLRGLMCIPAPAQSAQDEQRLVQEFDAMQHAFEHLKSHYSTVDTLSMGMSGDMAQAIQHGSTLVRIGTAIFGPRN